MERYHVPGVAIGILYEGKEYVECFGMTSIENPLPVDSNTLFQIGSTTKTITATCAMRLVEMGQKGITPPLQLDAPIRLYLPDFRLRDESVAARITLRHLLTHRGGWLGDYFHDTGDGDDALAQYVAKMIELPQLTPLDSLFHYNNSGFALVGRVIEKVTGKTVEAAIQEFVLAPLGMTDSFFFPRDVMTRKFVVGHMVVEDKPQVARPWPVARSANPAGGIASSLKDQLRYAQFCMRDGSPLLSRDTMHTMQSPQANADLDEKVGLSWFIYDVNNLRIVRHGGATLGQMSAFLFVPKHRFAIMVLTNSNRGSELHREITNRALELYLGVKEPEPTQIVLSDTHLAEYTGQWRSPLCDINLSIGNRELKMQVKPKGGFPDKDSPPGPTPPETRAIFICKDRVVMLDGHEKGLQGEFLRNDKDEIVWFRFGKRVYARQ